MAFVCCSARSWICQGSIPIARISSLLRRKIFLTLSLRMHVTGLSLTSSSCRYPFACSQFVSLVIYMGFHSLTLFLVPGERHVYLRGDVGLWIAELTTFYFQTLGTQWVRLAKSLFHPVADVSSHCLFGFAFFKLVQVYLV